MSAHRAHSGIRLVTASDSLEALRLAVGHQPAAVMLDIRRPRLDGGQELDRLRDDSRTASVPVLVASVRDGRARGLARGAAAYLLKPVSRDDLMAAPARVGVGIDGVRSGRP